MGYLKNEKATRETIDSNKFVHSGDLGSFDKNNNLLITGRSKELLITAGGENVAPVPIEAAIKDAL
jgi:long-chain-fatty-acid--CoA ligase ACSBG